MLSLDLFDSKFEKKLHEGALDDTIVRTQAHLMEPLSRRAADIRTQIRNGKLTGAELDKLEKEYEDLVQKRQDIIFNRQPKNEQQVPSKQDPFAYVKPEPRGIGDIQDPRAKMAQLAQQSKKGPLANVGAGLKAFIKGEPEPMGEEQQGVNPRALGVANFQRLVKANMGNVPTVSLEFIRPEENFKLDQKGLDLISDYYDGLENDQAKNYFIYRVLPSGDETKKILKQIGWNPQQIQQPLPGIPTQGELPLEEKKKSKSDDLEAGDVKVARELQKLRAQYPAARSDVEAVARAEIDSTERSQQQLAAIRGANEKQDALLKQLVSLDQEQGREISGLDKENNSLEQRLAQVQATNDRLQQAVGKMASAKKAAKPQKIAPQGSADLAQGGIVDVGTPAAPAPNTTSSTSKKSMDYTAQQIQGLGKSAPDIRGRVSANDGDPQLNVVGSDIREHGGGIGPKQHWQDLMQETVTDVRPLWADVYRRLAPKIERHRDSFLAGQLYDELENIAELHGAEGEFKQMMNGARNRAHMEYDTNPGGFQNWFWFLPFEDNDMTEGTDDIKKRMSKLEALALAANRAGDDAKCKMYQQKIQSLKQKLSQSMSEAVDEKGALKSAQAAAKFIIRNLDDRAALKDYSMHFWSPTKFYQGATMAMRGAGFDEIVKQITQDRPAQFESANDQVKQVFKDKAGRPVGEIGIDPESSPGNGEWYVYHYATGYSVVGFDSAAEAKRELLYVHKHPDAVEGHPSTKEQGVAEGYEHGSKVQHPKYGAGQIVKVYPNGMITVNFPNYLDPVDKKPGVQGNFMPGDSDYQSLKSGMAEGWSDAVVARRTGGARTPYAVYIKGKKWKDFENEDLARAVANKLKAKFKADGRDPETVTIAPTDMTEEALVEGIKDTASATAVIACLLTGGSLTGCATAPQQTSAQQVLKTGQDLGRTVQTAQRITRAGVEAEVNQEIRNLLRGINRPEELNHSNILRIWRRVNEPKPQQNEAREIVSKEDFVRERDRLLRMIGQETNPANKQILKSAIRQLENRAENEGWITIQNRMVREDSDSGEAVEMAIMRRMLIAHTDLIVEFGLDKVVNAIEEVAHDVGDVDEIGSSDVSGWVRQVRQILGADA
jgi:hypothetical protein